VTSVGKSCRRGKASTVETYLGGVEGGSDRATATELEHDELKIKRRIEGINEEGRMNELRSGEVIWDDFQQ
jgi:hypothetical protein